MEQLHELEKRVLDIIQKNQEMQKENRTLKAENSRLVVQCQQLEASLLKRGESAATLESEKSEMKATIDELLTAINSLQANE